MWPDDELDRRNRMALDDPAARPRKPTAAQLGVDLSALEWQRSGSSESAFEVAFVGGEPGHSAGGEPARRVGARSAAEADWVLLRVAGDPAGRVLVYDRVEWACFVDGARNGEFDPAGAAPRREPGLVDDDPGLRGDGLLERPDGARALRASHIGRSRRGDMRKWRRGITIGNLPGLTSETDGFSR
jgi:hypothetical protein